MNKHTKLRFFVLLTCCYTTAAPAQSNPIAEERERRLQVLGGELEFLSQYCDQFLSDNSAASDQSFLDRANSRGYTTNGFSPLSSSYDTAGLSIEEFFFRALRSDDGYTCEVHVSYPEGEDTIVAQAFGQQILNLKPLTYELIQYDSWERYTNAEYSFAYRQDDGRPPPKTQTLVFERLPQ